MTRSKARPLPGQGRFVGALGLLVVGILLGAVAVLALREYRPDLLEGDQGGDTSDDEPSVQGQIMRVARDLMEPQGPSRVIYLNREGASLRGGPDDASFNVSSVVASSPDNRAQLPPFAGSLTRFRSISKCIREKFAAYGVQVVEQRPVTGDYLMVMMGGEAKDLGFDAQDGHAHSHATGLAPFNGQAIPRAVVFVFTRTLRENTRTTCETAGMEIAHAYGLDHARDCRDLMTYMKRCGTRTFLDKDLACGEHEDRPCAHGEAVQNSHRRLLAVLGPASPTPVAAAAQ